jgi:hypothetical protein
VSEAADRLGLSLDAVRSRIKRGTLPTEREDGRVFVLVDDVGADQGATDQPTDQGDQSEPLVAELREQVSYLGRNLTTHLFAAPGAIATVDNAYVAAPATVKHVAAIQVTGLKSIFARATAQDVGVGGWPNPQETATDDVISPQSVYLVVGSRLLV